jgi:hypothetical protein
MTIAGREQFTLECSKCGRRHSGSMSWLQSNDVLVFCEGCGAKTPIDKDAVMRQLAEPDLSTPAPWVEPENSAQPTDCREAPVLMPFAGWQGAQPG